MKQYDAMITPSEREERLPAWARDLLWEMRATMQSMKRDLDAALFASEPGESDAIINPFGNARSGTGPQGLGKDPEVRFVLTGRDDRGFAHVDVRVSRDRRYLKVLGSGQLTVQPIVSNHLDLWVPGERGASNEG